jgi:hypothetical protein
MQERALTKYNIKRKEKKCYHCASIIQGSNIFLSTMGWRYISNFSRLPWSLVLGWGLRYSNRWGRSIKRFNFPWRNFLWPRYVSWLIPLNLRNK